jgi:hypothetical protein
MSHSTIDKKGLFRFRPVKTVPVSTAVPNDLFPFSLSQHLSSNQETSCSEVSTTVEVNEKSKENEDEKDEVIVDVEVKKEQAECDDSPQVTAQFFSDYYEAMDMTMCQVCCVIEATHHRKKCFK